VHNCCCAQVLLGISAAAHEEVVLRTSAESKQARPSQGAPALCSLLCAHTSHDSRCAACVRPSPPGAPMTCAAVRVRACLGASTLDRAQYPASFPYGISGLAHRIFPCDESSEERAGFAEEARGAAAGMANQFSLSLALSLALSLEPSLSLPLFRAASRSFSSF
jgi:hypothetical protein